MQEFPVAGSFALLVDALGKFAGCKPRLSKDALMAYEPLEGDELGAVVTYLEMRRSRTLDVPCSPLHLVGIEQPSVEEYRRLFRLVGAPWLWFSRLVMTDEQLIAIIGDPKVELYVVRNVQGEDVGFLELDFRQPRQCELAFVGLVPELSGKGHGRWLLGKAIERSWRDGVERVHVHTCSLDHPAALSAYRKAGFSAYKRAIERFPDPRKIGILPKDCAPQIPLLGSES